MKWIEEHYDELRYFPAWMGGRDTLQYLERWGNLDEVEKLIEEIFSDHFPSETEINDFLWFETDLIAERLGFKDWEEYLSPKNHEI